MIRSNQVLSLSLLTTREEEREGLDSSLLHLLLSLSSEAQNLKIGGRKRGVGKTLDQISHNHFFFLPVFIFTLRSVDLQGESLHEGSRHILLDRSELRYFRDLALNIMHKQNDMSRIFV